MSLPSDDAIMATMNRMGSCNGAVALYGLVKQSDAVWQIYYRAGRSWKDDAKLLEAHNGKWFVHCVSGISQYLLEVEQNQAQPPSSGPS